MPPCFACCGQRNDKTRKQTKQDKIHLSLTKQNQIKHESKTKQTKQKDTTNFDFSRLELDGEFKQKLLAGGIIESSGGEIVFSKDWTAIKEEIFESRKNRRVIKIDESYLDNQIQLIENM